MRTRANYGVIGASVTPPSSLSGGVYSAVDQQVLKSQNKWPAPWPWNSPTAVEMLLVAGGGGGGQNAGGGGGAGGLLYYGPETPKTPNGSAITIAQGYTYTLSIGAGGVSSPNSSGTILTTGGDTKLIQGASTVLYSAFGGGQGAHRDYGGAGRAGGSGGGGSGYGQGTQSSAAANPGVGTAGQGNQGGTGSPDGNALAAGAGGGGAGGVGASYSSSNPYNAGAGGVGLPYSISGSSTYYAGGGGGMAFNGLRGLGGNGGGGNGTSNGSGLVGSPGSDNSGGGGGGGGFNGGSGIAILRYPSSYAKLPSITGTYSYVNTGSYHIYTFTSSSTFTF